MKPFNQWGYPGTRVFEGMQAAANAGQAYSADQMAYMQQKQMKAERPLRDLQRQMQLSDLQTELPLAQEANKVMLGLQKYSGKMNTPEGFVEYLNAERSDPAGGKYRLAKNSSGQEQVELIGQDGSLITTMPAYSGDSARRWAIRNGGENLMALRGKLRDLDYREGTLATQLAQSGSRNDLAMMKMQMQQEMQMMRLQNAIAGIGGKGGKGGKDGGIDLANAKFMDDIRKENMSRSLMAEGLRQDRDGNYLDFAGNPATAEQVKRAMQRADVVNSNFVRGIQQGIDPVIAMQGADMGARAHAVTPAEGAMAPVPNIPPIGAVAPSMGVQGLSPFTSGTLPVPTAGGGTKGDLWVDERGMHRGVIDQYRYLMDAINSNPSTADPYAPYKTGTGF